MNTKILTLLTVLILLTPTVAIASNTFTVNYNLLIASFTVEITAPGQTEMNFSGPNTNMEVYPDGTNGGTLSWGAINNTGGYSLSFNISAPTNTGVQLLVGSNSALKDGVPVTETPASPTGWNSIASGSSANIFAKAVYSPNIDTSNTTCTIGGIWSCDASTTSCNGVCVDTTTNLNNCGTCGTVCLSPPNSAAACTGSACTSSCNVGFGNCDGNTANGCEINLNSISNCGACGIACSNGQTCTAGQCVGQPVCNQGSTQSCYTGPVGTQGVGVCKSGTQTCSINAWGSCVGDVTPTTEVCDGIDNNCNAQVDEGCQKTV